MTFRKRFIFLFLFVSLIPICLVQVYTFLFFVPSMNQNVTILITDNLKQKSENIRLLLRQEVDIIYQAAGDPGLADSIRLLGSKDAGTVALQENRIIESFSRLSLFHNPLAGMGYLSADGLFVEYDKYLMARDAVSFDRYFPLQRIKTAVDRFGGLQFFPTTVFRDRANLPKNLFLVAFPYVDVSSMKKNGYLFLLLHESSIREILNSPESFTNGIMTRTFLFDSEGRIYSAPNDAFFNSTVPSTKIDSDKLFSLGHRLPELKGRPIKTIFCPGPYRGWMLGTVYDDSSIVAARNLLAVYALLLGLFFLVLAGAAIYWGFRSLSRSFTRLMDSVTIDEARLDLPAPSRTADEFEVLGALWNRMNARISELIAEVNARNATLLTLAEERRIAEIRALEAQVNPHFLYNTLNTLNWMAIGQGQSELSQGISDLAEIMRYSISQIDVVATFEEEKSWLLKYLSLQRVRFGANLEYKIVDNGVPLDFRLFKLLLQPFVENSLVHAFSPAISGNLLVITFALTTARKLRVVLEDNGKGFPFDRTATPGDRGSIGIANAEKRIKSYYGAEASVSFESSLPKGTKVILEVPEAKL